MTLDKVLLAARHEQEDLEAHDHLATACPWFRAVGNGTSAPDPEIHCKPAVKKNSGPPRLVVKMAGDAEIERAQALATEAASLLIRIYNVLQLTPRTPEASTVVEPTVPPGGPGLFHIKGEHLPPYVEHLYKHLVGRYGRKRAYGVAIGVVKKWAAGVNPGGRHPTHTHADVRAAAAKNVAEWEESKAKAHARHHG